MKLFRISLGVNVIVCLLILYFFFAGLADGTISSTNILLWLAIMLASGAIVIGSRFLSKRSRLQALILLPIPAKPAVPFLIYILIASFGNKSRN